MTREPAPQQQRQKTEGIFRWRSTHFSGWKTRAIRFFSGSPEVKNSENILMALIGKQRNSKKKNCVPTALTSPSAHPSSDTCEQFRPVRKRRPTQRPLGSVDVWPKSGQYHLVGAQSNAKSGKHPGHQDPAAAGRAGRHLRPAGLQPNGPIPVDSVAANGPGQCFDCQKCCGRHP